MKLTDVARLRKFMALTTSDNDAEALAALRQANKLLAVHGLTWEAVFNRTIKADISIEEVNDSSDTPKVSDMADHIDAALQKLLDKTPPGSFRDFVLDLESKWRTTRYLTKPQRDALFKAAQRL